MLLKEKPLFTCDGSKQKIKYGTKHNFQRELAKKLNWVKLTTRGVLKVTPSILLAHDVREGC